MAHIGEKIFLGITVLVVLAFFTGPSKLQLPFSGEALTGALVGDNVRSMLQAPLFWIILFVVLCVLVYVTSKRK